MGLIAKRGISLAPNTNGYYEWLPSGYATTKKYPLIIFLHGKGQLGNGDSQLSSLLTEGLPMVLNTQGFTEDVIIISPQFNAWPAPSQIEGVITSCILTYNIDASRIYLTGLSMGGAETLSTAGISSRLAAVLAVCPVYGWNQAGVNNIVKNNLPVMSFHATDDSVASVDNTHGWVDILNKSNIKPPAKKVIFPTGNHNIWNTVYDPSYFFEGFTWFSWLLQYNKNGVILTSSTTTSTSSTTTTSTTKPLPISAKLTVGTASGWSSDSSFRIGGNYMTTTLIYGNSKTIRETTEQELFNQEVFDKKIVYSIPAQNGNYTLRLHFAELYHNVIGKRVFNVTVQDKLVLNNFDILANTTKLTALSREFPILVENGFVKIDFTAIVDNASISGIELIRTDSYKQTVVVEYRDITNAIVKTYTDTFNFPVKVNVK